MTTKAHSNNKIAITVSSFLQELDFQNIAYTPKQLAATITIELILFGALKASINRLLKLSKVDKDLSREISNIVQKNYIVRSIQDQRIFSFHDDKNTIWISEGLIKLLDREELIAVMLHEVGHGKEKIKILYDHLTSHPTIPKKLKPMYSALGVLLKSRGVVSDPMMMTRVYMLTYILYVDLIGNPFKGLYKWSYSDLAIQAGYWDQYESALYKINKQIHKQQASELSKKIAKIESENPGSIDHIKKDLQKTAGENSDNIEKNVKDLSANQKIKPNRSFISKLLRSRF